MLTRDALLVVFGDLDVQGKKVSGNTIYDYLTQQSVWFVARIPKGTDVGMPVIFYQSAVGFRGTAIIESINETSQEDRRKFAFIPLAMYPSRLTLMNLSTFPKPRDPRPLLEKLTFVSNKTYWGHSFRSAPRMISTSDYNIIAH